MQREAQNLILRVSLAPRSTSRRRKPPLYEQDYSARESQISDVSHASTIKAVEAFTGDYRPPSLVLNINKDLPPPPPTARYSPHLTATPSRAGSKKQKRPLRQPKNPEPKQTKSIRREQKEMHRYSHASTQTTPPHGSPQRGMTRATSPLNDLPSAPSPRRRLPKARPSSHITNPSSDGKRLSDRLERPFDPQLGEVDEEEVYNTVEPPKPLLVRKETDASSANSSPAGSHKGKANYHDEQGDQFVFFDDDPVAAANENFVSTTQDTAVATIPRSLSVTTKPRPSLAYTFDEGLTFKRRATISAPTSSRGHKEARQAIPIGWTFHNGLSMSRRNQGSLSEPMPVYADGTSSDLTGSARQNLSVARSDPYKGFSLHWSFDEGWTIGHGYGRKVAVSALPEDAIRRKSGGMPLGFTFHKGLYVKVDSSMKHMIEENAEQDATQAALSFPLPDELAGEPRDGNERMPPTAKSVSKRFPLAFTFHDGLYVRTTAKPEHLSARSTSSIPNVQYDDTHNLGGEVQDDGVARDELNTVEKHRSESPPPLNATLDSHLRLQKAAKRDKYMSQVRSVSFQDPSSSKHPARQVRDGKPASRTVSHTTSHQLATTEGIIVRPKEKDQQPSRSSVIHHPTFTSPSTGRRSLRFSFYDRVTYNRVSAIQTSNPKSSKRLAFTWHDGLTYRVRTIASKPSGQAAKWKWTFHEGFFKMNVVPRTARGEKKVVRWTFNGGFQMVPRSQRTGASVEKKKLTWTFSDGLVMRQSSATIRTLDRKMTWSFSEGFRYKEKKKPLPPLPYQDDAERMRALVQKSTAEVARASRLSIASEKQMIDHDSIHRSSAELDAAAPAPASRRGSNMENGTDNHMPSRTNSKPQRTPSPGPPTPSTGEIESWRQRRVPSQRKLPVSPGTSSYRDVRENVNREEEPNQDHELYDAPSPHPDEAHPSRAIPPQETARRPRSPPSPRTKQTPSPPPSQAQVQPQRLPLPPAKASSSTVPQQMIPGCCDCEKEQEGLEGLGLEMSRLRARSYQSMLQTQNGTLVGGSTPTRRSPSPRRPTVNRNSPPPPLPTPEPEVGRPIRGSSLHPSPLAAHPSDDRSDKGGEGGEGNVRTPSPRIEHKRSRKPVGAGPGSGPVRKPYRMSAGTSMRQHSIHRRNERQLAERFQA